MKGLGHAAEVALAAAREAAALVMGVYETPFEVQYKAKDDPVTRADREANALLCDRLSTVFPGAPIVAEESEASTYAGYAQADVAWFVDPLDGTREFVARNGEFSVMIGLAVKGRAVLGVVVAPAWGRSFFGVVGDRAWEVSRSGSRTEIHPSPQKSLKGASVVLSRSRVSPGLTALVEGLGVREIVPHGSSGLKGALVASGAYDVYLQPGRAGMLWDACATEALVNAAGGRCTDAEGSPFEYATKDLINNRGLVATNQHLAKATVEALAAMRHA
jgi:3'(2'), 5'-bisphosphate nucleotidase